MVRSNKEILAFVHIEKTAGRTLHSILNDNFGIRYAYVRTLYRRSRKRFGARDLWTYLAINPSIRAVGGHCVVPSTELEEHFPNVKYISLLRNPVERYISYYSYGGGPVRKTWEFTFEEYLDIEVFRNFQTKKIAGCDDLDRAKEILKDKFICVGDMDLFDEFLCHLKQVIGDDFTLCYRSHNIHGRSRYGAILDKHESKIRDNNGNDIHLYEYVKEVLIPMQREAYRGDIGKDVEKLQELNKLNEANCKTRYFSNAYKNWMMRPLTGTLRQVQGLYRNGVY